MHRCSETGRPRWSVSRPTRRPHAPAPASMPCLCPVNAGPTVAEQEARAAIAAAGGASASAPLLRLVVEVASRARSLRQRGLANADAERLALDELDFNNPLLLGPLVSTIPGMDGGRREIELAIRDLLRRALAELR